MVHTRYSTIKYLIRYIFHEFLWHWPFLKQKVATSQSWFQWEIGPGVQYWEVEWRISLIEDPSAWGIMSISGWWQHRSGHHMAALHLSFRHIPLQSLSLFTCKMDMIRMPTSLVLWGFMCTDLIVHSMCYIWNQNIVFCFYMMVCENSFTFRLATYAWSF
jgi:hypothetical protein